MFFMVKSCSHLTSCPHSSIIVNLDVVKFMMSLISEVSLNCYTNFSRIFNDFLNICQSLILCELTVGCYSFCFCFFKENLSYLLPVDLQRSKQNTTVTFVTIFPVILKFLLEVPNMFEILN